MKAFIERYKQYRNFQNLKTSYRCGYAFIGIGSHSTQNLYPVINYLHIPLSYICCRDKRKIPLIENNFKGVKATTNLEEILSDHNIKGIFVSTAGKAHFDIAKSVLASGKSLFIEKPPCQNLKELEELSRIEQMNKNIVSLVGMQKRYAPCIQSLCKQLKQSSLISYRYVYATGLYPEGNPLLDLFIHPLDLVCHIFGKPKVKAVESAKPNGRGVTILIMLEHDNTCGIIELSTNYSWQKPIEDLSINTVKGTFNLTNMENLKFKPHGTSINRIPIDKVFLTANTEKTLWYRNAFTPTIENNQIFTQGYYSEIKTFAKLVETHKGDNISPLSSLTGTYNLIAEISRHIAKSLH